jgi:hypothetical protein
MPKERPTRSVLKGKLLSPPTMPLPAQKGQPAAQDSVSTLPNEFYHKAWPTLPPLLKLQEFHQYPIKIFSANTFNITSPTIPVLQLLFSFLYFYN